MTTIKLLIKLKNRPRVLTTRQHTAVQKQMPIPIEIAAFGKKQFCKTPQMNLMTSRQHSHIQPKCTLYLYTESQRFVPFSPRPDVVEITNGFQIPILYSGTLNFRCKILQFFFQHQLQDFYADHHMGISGNTSP